MPALRLANLPLLMVALASLVFLIFLLARLSPGARFLKQEKAPYEDPTLSARERARDLVSRLSLEEKAGQIALVERKGLKDQEDIARYGLGALLSGGGSQPDDDSPQGWQEMIEDYQSVAARSSKRIPLLYGTDAVHGHGNLKGATIFPHNIGLAASRDPELVRSIYRATAEELAATGIYWDFAPSLDVTDDPRWGRMYESFGSDPKLVAALGKAAIRGLQGDDPEHIFVLATAKHYLGGGETEAGSSVQSGYLLDQGNDVLSESDLRKKHLYPFSEAVRAGAGSVMVGLNSWQGRRLTSDRYWLTTVLKEELGFKGLLITDWYGLYALPGNDYRNTARAISAGIDLAMLPYDYAKYTADIVEAIKSGRLSQERLDDAVRRVLEAKFRLGLFDGRKPRRKDLEVIGSSQHRRLAREAVSRTLVILSGKHIYIPLDSDVLVAGSAADDTGRQAGGWTITWQGVEGKDAVPGATSILKGIEESSRATVRYKRNGQFDPTLRAPVGIAVVGEKPYAEGKGDDPSPSLSPSDRLAIAELRKRTDRLMVIVISGRPLELGKEALSADEIIAAWLPGSEGQGVADVLFGRRPPGGTLPVSWPLR